MIVAKYKNDHFATEIYRALNASISFVVIKWGCQMIYRFVAITVSKSIWPSQDSTKQGDILKCQKPFMPQDSLSP
jgi:hypothetical protein